MALCLLAIVLTGCSREPPEYISRYTPPPSPAPTAPPTAVVIIGDINTSGSAMGEYGTRHWPEVMAEKLQQQGVTIDLKVGAQDESGYVATGRTHDRVFAERIPELVQPSTQLIVLFGSANDMNTPADELSAAVQQTLTAAKTAAPNSRVLVIGPAWATTEPPQELVTVRDILQSGAEDVGATFVDPIAEGWFVDHADLLDADGTNPTDAGHRYLADKIAPWVANELRLPTAELEVAHP